MSGKRLIVALGFAATIAIAALYLIPDKAGSRVPPAPSPDSIVPDWQAGLPGRLSMSDLDTIRTSLADLEPAEAAAEIARFLASGDDRPTQLGFEIDSSQTISGWPTLRTFLIDLLLEIDPLAATRASREILANPTSADEWAIALRNVAKVEKGEESIDFLRSKTRELIDNPEWQSKPSIGFLNAFDVIVHTVDTGFTPQLSAFIREPDRPALTHAGFLTLDRLVLADPPTMLAQLEADTELNQEKPTMVAQLFARSDFRSGEQVGALREWLIDPSRSPGQIESFAASFPNHNLMVSNNLLTNQSAPSATELRDRDLAALETMLQWQIKPEFASLRPQLERITARLRSFLGDPAEVPLETGP